MLPGNYTLHNHQHLGSLTQQEAELRQTVHKQLIQPSNCQSLNEEQLNKYLGDKKTPLLGRKKVNFHRQLVKDTSRTAESLGHISLGYDSVLQSTMAS